MTFNSRVSNSCNPALPSLPRLPRWDLNVSAKRDSCEQGGSFSYVIQDSERTSTSVLPSTELPRANRLVSKEDLATALHAYQADAVDARCKMQDARCNEMQRKVLREAAEKQKQKQLHQ
eukprot:scaffold7049_cov147-Skeletonema_marinoi.AAC.5